VLCCNAEGRGEAFNAFEIPRSLQQHSAPDLVHFLLLLRRDAKERGESFNARNTLRAHTLPSPCQCL